MLGCRILLLTQDTEVLLCNALPVPVKMLREPQVVSPCLMTLSGFPPTMNLLSEHMGDFNICSVSWQRVAQVKYTIVHLCVCVCV